MVVTFKQIAKAAGHEEMPPAASKVFGAIVDDRRRSQNALAYVGRGKRQLLQRDGLNGGHFSLSLLISRSRPAVLLREFVRNSGEGGGKQKSMRVVRALKRTAEPRPCRFCLSGREMHIDHLAAENCCYITLLDKVREDLA